MFFLLTLPFRHGNKKIEDVCLLGPHLHEERDINRIHLKDKNNMSLSSKTCVRKNGAAGSASRETSM